MIFFKLTRLNIIFYHLRIDTLDCLFVERGFETNDPIFMEFSQLLYYLENKIAVMIELYYDIALHFYYIFYQNKPNNRVCNLCVYI